MSIIAQNIDSKLAECLIDGGVAVVRTDTLYGLLARADDRQAVERIYRVKLRDYDKSPIVLISSYDQLYDEALDWHLAFMQTVWPGAVSVVLPSSNAPSWIVRNNRSVAYCMPNNKALLSLIDRTGPLVAPSANPQGLPVAANIRQAKKYFGSAIDMYVDGGEVLSVSPSRLVRLSHKGEVEYLR